jgi:hypothetical protein
MYLRYIDGLMWLGWSSVMAVPDSVRARGRQGTKSLDLTIPAQLARVNGIRPGDIFIVNAVQDKNGGVSIHYKRVYSPDE